MELHLSALPHHPQSSTPTQSSTQTLYPDSHHFGVFHIADLDFFPMEGVGFFYPFLVHF
jgi:hypothetical protein